MNLITLLQPPRIALGNGCALQSVEPFAQRGLRRILLVTSTPVVPLLRPLKTELKKAGVSVVVAPMVDREPTVSMFEEALAVAKAGKVDGVLGVGGGSALDVAKLLAALCRGRQKIRQVFGINQLQGRKLFLACIPTTAGTGSEVSPNAILLDETDDAKKGVVSPHLVPDAAYVDPTLMLTVPPAVTASTGLDALTHCIEAYANRFAHPVVDTYALQGIRLISANLLRAVRDGGDLEARAALALGSLYGGLCLGPVNTAAVHALAYPLGGMFHVAHGVSNAVLLPHVLRFNLPAAPERYADIAAALGVERKGSAVAVSERGLKKLAILCRDSGIPLRLSELGVPRTAIPSMAAAAMRVTRLLKNNLRPLTEADAIRIYEGSY